MARIVNLEVLDNELKPCCAAMRIMELFLAGSFQPFGPLTGYFQRIIQASADLKHGVVGNNSSKGAGVACSVCQM